MYGRNKFFKSTKSRKFDRTQRIRKDFLARKKVQKRFLPERCTNCGNKIQHHHYLCDKCWLERKNNKLDNY